MTDRLVESGHISFEQAELAAGTDGTLSTVRLTELLGYFGAVAVFIATIAFMFEVAIGDGFPFGGIDNVQGGLVTLLGTAAVGWAGWTFTGSAERAARRAGGLLLGSAFGLWAVTVGLLLMDLDVGDLTPLVLVAPVVAAAWFIWQRFQSVPTMLVAFVTVTQVVSALLVLLQVTDYTSPQTMLLAAALSGGVPDMEWIPAVIAVGVGLGWVWLTHMGHVRPRNAAFAVGTLYAAFNGIDLFGTADGWVILFTGITLAVSWAGLTWRSSVLLALAVVHLIILIIMLMTILVDEMTAVQVGLWFGIPGLLALGYALMGMQPEKTEADAE